MLRRAFILIWVVPALVVLAGCKAEFSSDATSDVDRYILGGGGAAIEINHNGQSAMLGGTCARRMGQTLQQMKDEGKSDTELRATLKAACQIGNQSSSSNGTLAQPVRGRLFAPMRAGASSGTRSYGDYSYYYWFLRPLNYWSSRYQDNVSWCQSFFWGWRGGDCFNLFYDFRNYSYYKPYCYRYCFASIYSATSSSSSSSTSSAIRYDPCIANGCYGQWTPNNYY